MEIYNQDLLDQDYKAADHTPKSKKNAYVYSWGKNQNGELAIANNKNTSLPKLTKGYLGYVVNISSAKQHSALVTQQGNLYVSGSMLHGKLGLEQNFANYITKFTLVPAFRDLKVKQVSCGDYHTMCLLQNGDVYAWGGTLHGKLGHKLGRPSQVAALAKYRIKYVDSGDFHSVALSEKGELFSWGGGGPHKNKGQLGHGHQNDIENPAIIESLKDKTVRLVKCGGYHTIIVTSEQEIYAWGQGIYGQCGYGQFYDTPRPKKVDLIMNKQMYVEDFFMTDNYRDKMKVQQLALGGHHSMILTNRGHVFAFGYGSHGQLGLGKTENMCEPQLVFSLVKKNIIKLAVGWNHSIVLTSDHDVYSSGYGKKGQLGLGDEKIYINFTHVAALKGKRVVQIYAGGDNSWAVLDQMNPQIDNYQEPSPLRIPQQFTSVKSNLQGQSKISKSISKLSNNNFDMAEQMLYANEKVLDIIYTEVDYIHRFIRFSSKEELKATIKQKIEEYLSYCYSIEKGIKFHRFANDSQLYDANNNLICGPDYKKHCTLMIICNPLMNNPPYVPLQSKENDWNEYNRGQKMIGVSIGQIISLKQNSIMKSEKESLMCRWFLKFLTMFEGICEKTRFVQLRPKNFCK